MGVGQGGGRRLGSDVRRLHCRVRPLRGSWGSRQFFFGERVYPSLRASTDPGTCYSDSTTLSSQDLGCDELFAGSTTADNATHSSTDRHHSGHVYSTTSSCRARPG